VGPIARGITAYLSGRDPAFKRYIDGINKELGISIREYNSVMGRHLCRALSAQMIIKELRGYLEQVEPGRSGFEAHDVPKNAEGYGITEATRGMLSHFIRTDAEGYIKRYSLVVPTTWNIGPRTGSGKPGAVEQMLLGTRVANAKHPIELARIVRSTDPCMACSVH
jgi:hydrogenase large subunit